MYGFGCFGFFTFLALPHMPNPEIFAHSPSHHDRFSSSGIIIIVGCEPSETSDAVLNDTDVKM